MTDGPKELIAWRTPMAARFCGEKRTAPGDCRLGQLADEALESFTHADGKIYRSILFVVAFALLAR